MELQHATDVNMADDVANNKSTPLTDMKKDLTYMALRQKEDTKFDAQPPSRLLLNSLSSERPILKEKFIDSSSERLALISVCAIAVFIIMLRST
jgi:hypothetical protein